MAQICAVCKGRQVGVFRNCHKCQHSFHFPKCGEIPKIIQEEFRSWLDYEEGGGLHRRVKPDESKAICGICADWPFSEILYLRQELNDTGDFCETHDDVQNRIRQSTNLSAAKQKHEGMGSQVSVLEAVLIDLISERDGLRTFWKSIKERKPIAGIRIPELVRGRLIERIGEEILELQRTVREHDMDTRFSESAGSISAMRMIEELHTFQSGLLTGGISSFEQLPPIAIEHVLGVIESVGKDMNREIAKLESRISR